MNAPSALAADPPDRDVAPLLHRLYDGADLDAAQAEELFAALVAGELDDTGICFLFAPRYHPGLRHAGPVRRTLKVRTIMNILGPCLNPAEPQVQLLGVADPRLVEPVARTLAGLGVRDALVVHGAGLDEVAIHGETEAARLHEGEIERLTLTPDP